MPHQHYINLSRGFECGCPPNTGSRIIRIESTACEQKQWDKILKQLGADMFYELARGTSCVVHDKSERDRETRACWQGLSWIRYACGRAWMAAPAMVPKEFSRNGMEVTPFWEEQFRALPDSTRRMLDFYVKFYRGGMIDLYSCYMPKGGVLLRFPEKITPVVEQREEVAVCAVG